MAKLVIQSADQKGRSYELKVDKTTVGRVDDNTFQIADASVSSHHCEIWLRGAEVVVKDLNSTNGTFINDEKITESTLKPGQKLRLGQVELSLDTGAGGSASTAPAAASPATTTIAGGPKKQLDQTVAMKRGVSLDELEQGNRPTSLDTANTGFSKKSNKANKWFLVGSIIVVVVVGITFLIILATIKR